MKKFKYLIIATFLLLLSSIISCEDSENTKEEEKTYIVASEKRNCVGVGSQKCFLVKNNKQDNWQFFYTAITGFEYEEGFEYELLVSEKEIENPPQDTSSVEYILIKVVSKVKKSSENLPN